LSALASSQPPDGFLGLGIKPGLTLSLFVICSAQLMSVHSIDGSRAMEVVFLRNLYVDGGTAGYSTASVRYSTQ
jgi:hypothetical protein